MGYYMEMEDSKFFLPAANKSLALLAIKSLDVAATKAHKPQYCSPDIIKTKTDTLETELACWEWNTYCNTNGDIIELTFDGGKLKDDDKLLSAIAQYVKAGSYIVMRGEDGYIWRWWFNGAELEIHEGRITFTEDDQ